MIATLIAALVAAVIAPAGLRTLPTRPNFRGAAVAFPAGAVGLAATLLLLGPLELLGDLPEPRLAMLFLGVALLGLMDDLLSTEGRGLRGHLRAVLGGHFSTGALKAAGTLSLAAAALWDSAPFPDVLIPIAVVVLCTNLFNLLDLRPGRTTKAFVLVAAGLLLAGGDEHLDLIGPFAAPLVVLGLFDLRERCMLGDTGANLLGVLAGVWLVAVLDQGGEAVALAVLAALTMFGEFGSFSRTIDKLPPLRALDSFGRKSHV